MLNLAKMARYVPYMTRGSQTAIYCKIGSMSFQQFTTPLGGLFKRP